MTQSGAMLRLSFADEAEAERLLAAVAPENAGFVQGRREGRDLVFEAEADSPLSLLRTMDDLLACLTAARKAGRV